MNIKETVFDLYKFSFDGEITEIPIQNGVYVKYSEQRAEVGGDTTPELMRAYTLLAKKLRDGKNLLP